MSEIFLIQDRNPKEEVFISTKTILECTLLSSHVQNVDARFESILAQI